MPDPEVTPRPAGDPAKAKDLELLSSTLYRYGHLEYTITAGSSEIIIRFPDRKLIINANGRWRYE